LINNSKLLAIIPARGGSKRLPNKNILELSGKPLIVWTIDAAKRSKYIDRIVVSTDDGDIAETAINAGVDVPFIRPTHLAEDQTSTYEVVAHTLTQLRNYGDQFQYLLLLQPTSPLRTTEHIDGATDLLISKNADAVISVTEANHLNEWSGEIPESLCLEKFFHGKTEKRSQEDVSKLLAYKTFFLPKNIVAYRMKREASIDIDTQLDFQLAEYLIKLNNL
jgi:CMP-N-acetylneuraminic acid synthetase